MNYTIIDWLDSLRYSNIIESAPYVLSIQDHEELEDGTYLKSQESIVRVVGVLVEVLDLKRPHRKRYKVDQRKYLYQYLRSNTKLTVQEIGSLFNQHHSSVIHGLKMYKAISKDPTYLENTKSLSEFLTNSKLIP